MDFRFIITTALLTEVAALLAAQEPEPNVKLLPSDATVIETAAVTGASGNSRTLMLWMKHPKKVARPPANARACEDLFLGDHWVGPHGCR